VALPAGDAVLLLHNPRCSKSRAAKALLEERGIPYTERNYLETPLTRDELDELARRLGRSARELVRTGDPAFSAMGLTADAPEATLLDAVAAAPQLLERPILVRGSRAVVGRPPDAVLGLL
jgi:arsenate reductase